MPREPRAQQDVDKLLGVLPTDHVLGKADAPNIIIDYFSLTCPHCANFHAAVLPVIKSEWIDTGRPRFIYRHFPSDAIATRGQPAGRVRRPRSSSRRSMRCSSRRSTG